MTPLETGLSLLSSTSTVQNTQKGTNLPLRPQQTYAVYKMVKQQDERSEADAPFFLFLTGTAFGSSIKLFLVMLPLCVPPEHLD